MARYIFHKQKLSDKFGVGLVKFAFKFKAARERYNFKFKFAFTNTLSKKYSYGKSITYDIIDINGTKTETIYYLNQESKYALIQLHGGAYVSGYNDSYRKTAKKYLKSNKNLRIYSLCYSLAPKHPFPKALEEAIDLYNYLLDNGYKSQNIIIAGDSAGGGLTLALGLALKDKKIPLPKAMITMSAWTDFAAEGMSYEKNKLNDTFFGIGTSPLPKKDYAGDMDFRYPYISPKYGDYTDFSDLLMFVGGHELIESDTLDLAEKVENAIVHDYDGMFHVFPLGFNKMASSRSAWRIINEFINNQIGR
ncbi:MAG: alpha/beta hydrolase fold domain-containing protein [Candidatus Izemoplasmatales bacterium]